LNGGLAPNQVLSIRTTLQKSTSVSETLVTSASVTAVQSPRAFQRGIAEILPATVDVVGTDVFATTQKSVGISESLPTSDMAAADGTNHVQIRVIDNTPTAAGISVDRYAPAQRFVGVSEQILTNDSVAAVLNKRRFTMVILRKRLRR